MPSLKNEITELELIEGTASQIDLEVEALDKNGNIVSAIGTRTGDYFGMAKDCPAQKHLQ